MGLMNPASLRARFSAALSAMYRAEVPAYGQLIDLVADTNIQAATTQADFTARLKAADGLSRLSEERHGAIRLGTAAELAMMRRLFALMDMHPVGYYDLSVAGIPVHSTAFRPLHTAALAQNPFRVFTSLLRLDFITDQEQRQAAEAVLAKRQIFSPEIETLIIQAEAEGGVPEEQADAFIDAATAIFRWQGRALVSAEEYEAFHAAHRLITDVVSFPGPHINHLTPRTLDIDAAQSQMQAYGLAPKAIIEGPPRRNCPLLLRQTSFKALEEPVQFADGKAGAHTARFGEIEQRGVALTPAGRALYDQSLARARADVTPAADGRNADQYKQALDAAFAAFPDDWDALEEQNLAYFQRRQHQGKTQLLPIIYEDFLPVSAAGIFQSNLGDDASMDITEDANQKAFETALGAAVHDPFQLYQAQAETEPESGP